MKISITLRFPEYINAKRCAYPDKIKIETDSNNKYTLVFKKVLKHQVSNGIIHFELSHPTLISRIIINRLRHHTSNLSKISCLYFHGSNKALPIYIQSIIIYMEQSLNLKKQTEFINIYGNIYDFKPLSFMNTKFAI